MLTERGKYKKAALMLLAHKIHIDYLDSNNKNKEPESFLENWLTEDFNDLEKKIINRRFMFLLISKENK